MEIYLYVELNVFAEIILLLIFLNIHHKTEKYLTEQKIFLVLLGLIALILVADTFTWILDGGKTPLLRNMLILTTVIYYILNPIVCMTWFLYIDFLIYRNEGRLKKLILPLLIPVIILAALSILSVFNQSMFYLDSNNVYHRGKYFIILAAISYSYLLYALLFIILNHKKIHKSYFIPSLMFAIPPIIGGIIQLAFYGISLVWIGTTISVLIIFINIQNEQMYLDYLTGLYNRRQLDFYLQELIQKNNSKTVIAGIMLDIDSFKNINDHYGHYSGDEALKCTSQIIKKSFSNQAFISRFGGDEFVVLLEIKDEAEMVKVLDRLKESLQDYNSKKATPYEINLSIGAAIYDSKLKMTGLEFLKNIDTLMYIDKQTSSC